MNRKKENKQDTHTVSISVSHFGLNDFGKVL